MLFVSAISLSKLTNAQTLFSSLKNSATSIAIYSKHIFLGPGQDRSLHGTSLYDFARCHKFWNASCCPKRQQWKICDIELRHLCISHTIYRPHQECARFSYNMHRSCCLFLPLVCQNSQTHRLCSAV